MNKDVLISISGLQFTEGETSADPIEFITGGDYYRKNNSHYILYDEISSEVQDITKNTIKLKDDKVEILKKGISNVHMVFEKGRKNHTCYDTPYGNLLLAIIANDISITESDNEIDVTIDYLLEANYEPIADCKIEMKIISKNGQEYHIS